MASVNKVIIIGNLGADPETRYTSGGDAISNIRVACSEKWKNKDGEVQEHTEWVRCVFFGKLAEIVEEYCKKGNPIYVEGKLRTRKWEDKDGNEKYSTEVVCDKMQLLGGRREGGEERPRGDGAAKPQQESKKTSNTETDDDIPF